MFSIGILGFLVWSQLVGPEINFTISQNLLEENSTNVQITGKNLSFLLKKLAENLHMLNTCFLSEIIREDFCSNLICLESNAKLSILFLTLNQKNNKINTLINRSINLKSFANIDPIWLHWFIGFVEGDGSLSCDSQSKLYFIITQKEKHILYQIQKMLGFGSVYFDKSAQCWRYRVTSLSNIYELASLFNGNLRLNHRINQLSSWIKVLKNKNYKINLIDKPVH